MRTLIFPLIFQLFFSISLHALHANTQIQDRLEHQAIKVLLDSLKSSKPKNDNLGVIIYLASHYDVFAWFKYKHNNEFIMINYFIFSEKMIGIKHDDKIPLYIFLGKIIKEENFSNYLNAYQTQTLMPPGLRKKTLLDLIYSDKPFNTTKDGWIQMVPKECMPFLWGFQRAVNEPSEYSSDYMINPLGEIILEIIDPMITSVLQHNIVTQINQALRK